MTISPANFTLFVSTGNNIVGSVYLTDMIADVANDFSTELPSPNAQTIYVWRGMIPKIREWIGARVTFETAPQTYTVINRPYELTLEVDRFELDDDRANWDTHFRDLADMARQVKRARALWLRDLLCNTGTFTGAVQNGYDGLSYFNTAHPVDVYSAAAGTYCNKFNSGGQIIGGINIGGQFGISSVATIAEYAPTISAEDGEPLGIIYNRCMIPSALQLEANLVLKALSMAPPAWGTITGQVGAADNPMLKFGIEPIVNTFLDGQSKTNFYMYDNTKVIKPMVWQVNTPAVFAPRVSETDPNVWDRHKYQWGSWGRVAPGWGYSFLMAIGGT